MCFSACHWAKISKIFYGTKIKDAKKLGFSELTIPNEKMKSLGGSKIKLEANVLREKNLEVFKLWLKEGDRNIY